MTINDLMNKLATIATTYGDDAEIDTVTLLDGDWLAVSGWAVDEDGEDVEIEERFKQEQSKAPQCGAYFLHGRLTV